MILIIKLNIHSRVSSRRNNKMSWKKKHPASILTKNCKNRLVTKECCKLNETPGNYKGNSHSKMMLFVVIRPLVTNPGSGIATVT